MSIVSIFLAVVAIIVSIIALAFAKRSADASERQAKAAEEQARAIPAQLAVAETAAKAAQLQSDIAVHTAEEAKKIAKLSEAQMHAALRPVLVVERRTDEMRNLNDFLVNTGDGAAMNITAKYGTGIPPAEIDTPNVLSPRSDTRFRVNWERTGIETIYLNYESQDGRKFITHLRGLDRWGVPTFRHIESS
jgi:hypothetical protein